MIGIGFVVLLHRRDRAISFVGPSQVSPFAEVFVVLKQEWCTYLANLHAIKICYARSDYVQRVAALAYLV